MGGVSMEWKEVRLGDIVSIKSGLAYKGAFIGKGENILLGMGCVSFKDKFLFLVLDLMRLIVKINIVLSLAILFWQHGNNLIISQY